MTDLRIKSIHKGEGIAKMTFTVGNRYKRIAEELKIVRFGEGTKLEFVVYRVYDMEDNMVVEIECCSGLIIYYGKG